MAVGPCRGMLTFAHGPSGGVFSTATNGVEESTCIRTRNLEGAQSARVETRISPRFRVEG